MFTEPLKSGKAFEWIPKLQRSSVNPLKIYLDIDSPMTNPWQHKHVGDHQREAILAVLMQG